MKKKMIPAITFGVALLIFGSIAYAADRRKNTKPVGQRGDKTHEEEALKVELLKNDKNNTLKSNDTDKNKKSEITGFEVKTENDLLAEVVRK